MFCCNFIHLFCIGFFSFFINQCLHPSVFCFCLCPSKIPKDFCLLFHQIYEFWSHSQPWPKEDPCCTNTLFWSTDLNAGSTQKLDMYCAEPEPISHAPLLFGQCPNETNWEGCVNFYCFHAGGLGVEGKQHISYWSNARMGALYNVELVNCVLWCKDDGSELLFLFYDMTVSVMNNSNLQWTLFGVCFCGWGEQ